MERSTEQSRGRGSVAVATTATVAFVAHTVAVLWVWWRWEVGIGASWVVWIDFPASLVYLDRTGASFLAWSLLAGGAWWAALGAMLSHLMGRLVGGG